MSESWRGVWLRESVMGGNESDSGRGCGEREWEGVHVESGKGVRMNESGRRVGGRVGMMWKGYACGE